MADVCYYSFHCPILCVYVYFAQCVHIAHYFLVADPGLCNKHTVYLHFSYSIADFFSYAFIGSRMFCHLSENKQDAHQYAIILWAFVQSAMPKN